MKYLFTHKIISVSIILLFVLCGYYAQPVVAQYDQDVNEYEDENQSPYFFVMSRDTSIDQLPLKKTSAEVAITGIIADVTVSQMYCNEGDSVLEAIYVFPASSKAAVYAMEMTVGNRLLRAQIKERQQAREEYEQAKEDGKTVTLLEQNRPNVFQMNVANILPGDTILVEMHYTELITPVDGVYEFVYPTVVGPRYGSPKEDDDGIEWIEQPYTHEGEPPLYEFDIDVTVNAGMEINEINCPSHAIDILKNSEDKATCALLPSEKYSGNKDFILRYRLAGDAIASGLLLFEGEEENFFLAMVQPPRNPLSSDIPPREYIFIMDVSGSMYGFPIDVSKALLKDIVGSLYPKDKFNLLFFAGGNYLLSESSMDATEGNIQKALTAIDEKQGGGGTELLPALNRALSLPGTEDYARIFVIATDGYVTVEKEAFDLIRTKSGEANFFPFGIGKGVNRYIIEGMAHAGMGEPMVAVNQDEALEVAERFRTYIESPVLTNIDVAFDGLEVYDVEPVAVPDVFAERPVIIFGKWSGEPAGTIAVTGNSGTYDYNEVIQVSDYKADEKNAALRYLWARHRIQTLDDYGKVIHDSTTLAPIREEVTQLGLDYNLLTKYTSFIAVDSIIRNDSSGNVTVEQPLPLPEGVSDLALHEGTGWYGGRGNTVFDATVNTALSDINRIYPNPFVDVLKIAVMIDVQDINKKKTIRIYNAHGKLVYEKDFTEVGAGIHELEIRPGVNNALSAGIYIIHLKVDGKTVKKEKVVKIDK